MRSRSLVQFQFAFEWCLIVSNISFYAYVPLCTSFSGVAVQIFSPFWRELCLIKFSEFFTFWHKSFIRYVTCKYFLPVCGLSFHFCNSVFQRIDFPLILVKFSLSIFCVIFNFLISLLHPRNLYLIQSHKEFLLCCLLDVYSFLLYTEACGSFWVLVLPADILIVPWKDYAVSTELPSCFCQKSIDYISVGACSTSLTYLPILKSTPDCLLKNYIF